MEKGGPKIRIFHLRVYSQIVFFLVAVLGIFGVGMTGWIYPFFFCPASPAACAGCPIWVIEHGTLEMVAGTTNGFLMVLYLIGLFLVVGVLVGRSFCGWACPVGSLQDLFSALDRKIKGLTGILVLSGVSLTMLVFGIALPYILSEMDVERRHYLWAGYVGAIGSFVLAFAGAALIKKTEKVLVPILVVLFGALFMIIYLASGPLSLDNTPLGSVELMGFLSLSFMTIGFFGLVHRWLGRKFKGFAPGGRADRALRYVKVAVLFLVAPTTYLFNTLFFTDIDPIGGITATVPELMLDPGGWSANQFFWYKMMFTAGVIVLVSFVDRGWCRYLCPVGAMYGPTNKMSLSDIDFRRSKCIHCQRCIASCPMGINPKESKRDPECIRCGRCIDVCPTDAQVLVAVNGQLRRCFSK